MSAFVGSQSRVGPVTGAFVGTFDSIDPDALAFVNTSGATDLVAINSFVLGAKALGIWNSMVSWPLRSSQNAGTGTTAYSLGGVGPHNGTLVGGPTWGASGLNMNALGRHVLTTAAANQPDTIFTVQVCGGEATGQIIYDGTVRQVLYRGAAEGFFNGFAGTNVVLNNYTPGVPFALQLSFNGASGSSIFNDGAPVTRNFGTNNLTAFRMGSLAGSTLGILSSFACIVSGASVPSLYSLYKSTLGEGLGLP